MVADEQTHEVPDDPAQLESFARFCGYPDTAAFSRALIARLETVQKHYAALFEDAPELTPGERQHGVRRRRGTIRARSRR